MTLEKFIENNGYDFSKTHNDNLQNLRYQNKNKFFKNLVIDVFLGDEDVCYKIFSCFNINNLTINLEQNVNISGMLKNSNVNKVIINCKKLIQKKYTVQLFQDSSVKIIEINSINKIYLAETALSNCKNLESITPINGYNYKVTNSIYLERDFPEYFLD
jgi:uncharacterized protein YaaW (UPF0174 family)